MFRRVVKCQFPNQGRADPAQACPDPLETVAAKGLAVESFYPVPSLKLRMMAHTVTRGYTCPPGPCCVAKHQLEFPDNDESEPKSPFVMLGVMLLSPPMTMIPSFGL